VYVTPSLSYVVPSDELTSPRSLDVFIGLNIVRILSILACLLVLASSIVTMVEDVEAVSTLIDAEKTNSTLANNLLDCDYVAYVSILPFRVCQRLSLFPQLQHGP
jgi:regulator of extracellular matrix RemA (YlzA/DUF370 family)